MRRNVLRRNPPTTPNMIGTKYRVISWLRKACELLDSADDQAV
jgi:hypothetical protein